MNKLKSIISVVKKNFPTAVKLPIMAHSCYLVEDKEAIEGVLYQAKEIWGNDFIGGLAYFGKSEDIEKICEQTQNYLSKMSKQSAENQFYLLWKIGDFSLLTLYEDYQADLENPYPVQENVLCALFGAWCDDDPLMYVLEDKKYIDDIFQWSFGGNKVDLNDSAQKYLLEEMKKTLLSIDSSTQLDN